MHVLTGALLAMEHNSGRSVYATRYASASTDSVAFDLVPSPYYVAGSLTPLRASSGASISFEARIGSDALRRSTLVLQSDKVFFSFADTKGDTFRTALSPVSDHVLSRGGEVRLVFRTQSVDTAIAHITLPAALHLEGTENGNPFAANISPLGDSVTVEKAPQLSIDRIVVPQSVTRSQSAAWPVRMILKNNGEASVAVALDVAKTFITFNIVGLGDRTYEYGITRPAHFEGSKTDTLAGGALDSLVFVITTTGSTPGLALVNGKVTGVDVNSGLMIADDTYDGGFSHMAIQLPGAPRVAQTVPSRSHVTSGQTTPWQIVLEACNGGEAALTLELDSTYVFYGARLPLSYVRPGGFVEGGLLLEGGACKHLAFNVSPTPVIPAGADIALHAHAGFKENNSSDYRYFDTRQSGSGSGSIRVQAPANLTILRVANETSRAPYVNTGQGFPVSCEVKNEGEARADSIKVALEKSGSSSITDTLVTLAGLDGSATSADTFRVVAGGSSGLEIFKARIRGALDENSHQSNLVSVSAAVDDTARAVIQQLASLAVLAVTPSQPEINANQSVDWTVRVSLRNMGEAPLAIGALASSDLSFSIGGSRLSDYTAIPPDTLASGAHLLSVAGGGTDALIYRVVSTGRDTGIVSIPASIPWHDMNDGGRSPATASGSGSVHVKPPSGLRIISVTSDAPNNALYPNTSV
ncbi:MAG TPA: hypothetical protein VMT60_03915, partial [Candidatus Bathyarchaeia archaeon]|nr:hypothetical protein [Candidatus Bathyarchaeia archaeon]